MRPGAVLCIYVLLIRLPHPHQLSTSPAGAAESLSGLTDSGAGELMPECGGLVVHYSGLGECVGARGAAALRVSVAVEMSC